MSAANGFISLAGWYLLPGLVTGYLQKVLYAVFIRAGDPKPQPGSPRFIRDRRYIHIFVIVAYLLYTVYDADFQLRQAGDFYRDLGVPYDATDKAIQSRFRRLTVQYHPDKVSSADRSDVGAIYVRLQVARDTLVDPAKRFAYDRFGPDILQWRQMKTIRDYVFAGVQNIAGLYLATAVGISVMGVLGYFQQGKFWRFAVMVALLLVEVHTMTRPECPAVLRRFINPIMATTKVRPPYLPFQMIALLRKLAITFFIAMSQLSPLLQGRQAALPADGSIPPQQLNQLDALTKATDQEVNRILGLELAPFITNAHSMKSLQSSIKDWLVQNTIRNDPGVKAAIQEVLERRRKEGRQRAQLAE